MAQKIISPISVLAKIAKITIEMVTSYYRYVGASICFDITSYTITPNLYLGNLERDGTP